MSTQAPARSTQGCVTCRLRKKKCVPDEPSCKACKRFKLQCVKKAGPIRAQTNASKLKKEEAQRQVPSATLKAVEELAALQDEDHWFSEGSDADAIGSEVEEENAAGCRSDITGHMNTELQDLQSGSSLPDGSLPPGLETITRALRLTLVPDANVPARTMSDIPLHRLPYNHPVIQDVTRGACTLARYYGFRVDLLEPGPSAMPEPRHNDSTSQSEITQQIPLPRPI
ncbi:uncharacterized protein EI90DRAFT_3119221 [Cantharellus anzutake]|uniref:uncharacterized protein n=1 Tax=Cantharellus anzutake TaxID=1750568 RepID=UPI001905201E|nr:uncharacterized protein EI90DRAFT_3119221 [Cantharellus anzutake]KAF8336908.1 hypothetical protein EI90DRAFT_3119221 [Cantharellus anzutake]